jgi:hypothetical protein
VLVGIDVDVDVIVGVEGTVVLTGVYVADGADV